MGFSQALSGMNAASQQLDTIGNNIANSQTKGFKSSSVQFADVYANSKIGLGTSVAGVLQNFSNGTLESTNRNLDLGIGGEGFLRFQQGSQVGYSRNGQLIMNNEGNLTNAQGGLLMGYNVSDFNDPAIAASLPTGGLPGVIQIPRDSMIAKATQNASAAVDLNSSDEAPTAATFDPNNVNSYNYSTASTIFDSQGNDYTLQMYFVKSEAVTNNGQLEGANTWRVETLATLGANNAFPKNIGDINGSGLGFNPDPSDPTSGGNRDYNIQFGGSDYVATVSSATAVRNNQGDIVEYTGGDITYTAALDAKTLTFNNNGQLVEAADQYADLDQHAAAIDEVAFDFDPQNGSTPLSFNFGFGGSTQTEQTYAINSPRQNGYASGQLVDINVEKDGTVVGSYANDQRVDLARISLTDFDNPEGLQAIGDNLWQETSASGQAILGQAGSGAFGALQAGTLEASNVDLSQELVDLIIAQRNFQANSNTVKTQDEILQTVVNLR